MPESRKVNCKRLLPKSAGKPIAIQIYNPLLDFHMPQCGLWVRLLGPLVSYSS